MGTSRRVALAVLITIVLSGGVLCRAAAAADEIAGIPTAGAPGVPETIGEIMARQTAAEAAGLVKTDIEDVEKEIEQPDRTGLPLNPASPKTTRFPELPPGMEQAPGPIGLSPQTVGTNFTAATLSGTNPTFSFPPDCMGAVGPSQYVVFVNGRLVTFNKSTGIADGVLNANPDVFFSSVINGSSTSDPRIRYDRLTGRWILVIINVSTPNRILLAVSDAASAAAITPSTVFTFFFLNIATTPPAISSTCLADYPTLGVDANALYIGTNNFCGSPQTFNSTDGYVIRKSSVLGAGPIVVTVFRGLVATASSAGPYTPQGVDNLDPASTEGYFIGVDNATFGTLMMRRVSNPGGTPTISANVSITVPATSFPINVNHLGNTGGTNGRLSALDDRLFAAHIRNGRLWTAHNIGVTNTGATSGTLTRDGSRWYELSVPVGSGTPTIVQSGTVFTASGSNTTDQRSYWIPSVMVSGQGHAALGFSTAGTNERANSATVGRLSGDALTTMQTPVLYTSSATAYNPPSDPGGAGGRRWGDYSYTSVDPLDDMTMWTVQMFCDATNSYGVRIAKLIAPPPATPSSVPDVAAGANPVNVTLTGAVVSGSGFFDPGTNLPGVPAFNHLAVSVTNGTATGTPPTVVSATYVNPTTVNLVLNASAATGNLAGEKYTVTVTNPDGQTASAAVLRVVGSTPTVSIVPAGPSLAEGNAGTTAFNFTVNLSATTGVPVTVFYHTGDGTATAADNDYQAATSSIVIPANTPSGTITVNGNGDTKFESDETFTVTLTSATNATLVDPKVATGTILNDDAQPIVSIVPAVALNEGNAGTTGFTFQITLSNLSAFPVNGTYQAFDGSALASDADYVPVTGGFTIPPGAPAVLVNVDVVGDTKHEMNEDFNVGLSGLSGGTFGVSNSVATILNDDAPPAMSIDNVTQIEGDAGATAFAFTVSLSAPSGIQASADFATDDSTATLLNNDYQASAGTVTFPPGLVAQPVVVTVNGDVTQEADEVFLVRLSNLVEALPGSVAGRGTIQNDDSTPGLSIGDVTRLEGNAGTTAFRFPVTLSHPTDQVVSVGYQTADSTATIADGDYQAASGTLILPAKTLGDTITVFVNGDTCGEADELFVVRLSGAVNATILASTGIGTIANDDDATVPTVTVGAPNGGENIAVGDTTTITWTASDNVAVTGVDIRLSRDGGATYPEVLASGIANSGSFAWIATGPPTGPADAFIQVKAHDGSCNTRADESDAGFQISSPIAAAPLTGSIREFALGSIRPNPTAGSTRIEFQLPRDAVVRLTVVDLQGREVSTLVNASYPAGRHTATWNGQTSRGPAAMGVYFIHFEAGGKSFTRRLVLSR